MYKIILLLFSFLGFIPLHRAVERPKLVIGIVVDQMRWDYLYRYSNRYTNHGFKRLLNQGYAFNNTQINYVPTITAIGHASVYTGSIPSIHGIAGNYFRINNHWAYCTEDTTVQGVGSNNKSGKMSPRNLLTTTIGDELRLATNFRSRTFSISLKDRGSILPGGHTANAAFWFDSHTGNFISSTYYLQKLPQWLINYNAQKRPQYYLNQNWETLFPLSTYTESTPDNTPYEKPFKKEKTPTFPHLTSKLYTTDDFGIIRSIPAGNTLTLELAQTLLKAEELGKKGETDMLTISLSATDYVGHRFGTNAIETEDTYLRLDRDIANFLAFLDKYIGKKNYLLFLTADHAASQNTFFLQNHKIPSDIYNEYTAAFHLNKYLEKTFGVTPIVKWGDNYQLFLNNPLIKKAQLNINEITTTILNYLSQQKGLAYATEQEKIRQSAIPEPILSRIINGYHRERSGEIQLVPQVAYYSYEKTGTTHGVWCPYDAHIPLIFYGWHIPKGETSQETHITDIAPTVTSLLHIQMPSGSIGTPLFPNTSFK